MDMSSILEHRVVCIGGPCAGVIVRIPESLSPKDIWNVVIPEPYKFYGCLNLPALSRAQYHLGIVRYADIEIKYLRHVSLPEQSVFLYLLNAHAANMQEKRMRADQNYFPREIG